MGQYHLTVNLDKREFLYPPKLGDGLKLAEQCGYTPGGVNDALHLLLAVSNGCGGRGGGDFYVDSPWIGHWGGDRIAVVGDYAEDSDLAPEHEASSIYHLCASSADSRLPRTLLQLFGEGEGLDPLERAKQSAQLFVYSDQQVAFDSPEALGTRLSAEAALLRFGWDIMSEVVDEGTACIIEKDDNGEWRSREEPYKPFFRDITDELIPVLMAAYEVVYIGAGWRRRYELHKLFAGWEYSHRKGGRVGNINGVDYPLEDLIRLAEEALGRGEKPPLHIFNNCWSAELTARSITDAPEKA